MTRKPFGRAATAILSVTSLAVASLVLATAADADEGPVVQIGDVTVVEGDTGTKPVAAKVPITLSQPAAGDLEITWTITGGTATSGVDYKAMPKSGVKTAKIKAGKTFAYASIPVLPDLVDEGDETIDVALTMLGGPGVTIVGGDPAVSLGTRTTGTVTIEDEDGDSVPTSVSIGGSSVVEPGAGAMGKGTLAVTLSDPLPASEVHISYRVLTGSATSGVDYKALNKANLKVAKIKAGNSRANIALTVLGDDDPEGDENVVIELVSVAVIGPDSVTIDGALGTLLILEPDTSTTTTTEGPPEL